jgi:hypothetical protein
MNKKSIRRESPYEIPKLFGIACFSVLCVTFSCYLIFKLTDKPITSPHIAMIGKWSLDSKTWHSVEITERYVTLHSKNPAYANQPIQYKISSDENQISFTSSVTGQIAYSGQYKWISNNIIEIELADNLFGQTETIRLYR